MKVNKKARIQHIKGDKRAEWFIDLDKPMYPDDYDLDEPVRILDEKTVRLMRAVVKAAKISEKNNEWETLRYALKKLEAL